MVYHNGSLRNIANPFLKCHTSAGIFQGSVCTWKVDRWYRYVVVIKRHMMMTYGFSPSDTVDTRILYATLSKVNPLFLSSFLLFFRNWADYAQVTFKMLNKKNIQFHMNIIASASLI